MSDSQKAALMGVILLGLFASSCRGKLIFNIVVVYSEGLKIEFNDLCWSYI